MNQKTPLSLALSLLSFLMPAFGLTALAAYTESRTSIEADETVAVGGVLTVQSTLDLQGHKLKYTGVTSITWGSDATFTSTGDTTGELWIEHSKAVTQSTAFSGNLKFIKDGEGTWTLPSVESSNHTGEMEILKGTLTTKKYGKAAYYPFGETPKITVREGATLDVYGCRGFSSDHVFTLDGGTLNGSRKDASNELKPSVVLSRDSFFTFTPDSIRLGASLSLSGYVLFVSASKECFWIPSAIENGTINLTSGTLTLAKDIGSATASLTLASETALAGAYVYSVSNLIVNTTSDNIASTIKVHGTYAPAAADGYYPVMMDGSTLDLSGLTEAAKPTAANFDSGTVTIALGARTLESNQQIVDWTAKPENVTFTFTGDNIVAGKTFTVSDSGIVYDAKSDVVTSATWTGNGVAGNWNDPNNWECRNASGQIVVGKCPPAELTVTFTGDVSGLALNASFPFAGARFTDAYLSEEKTWSGFDLNKISSDSVIDLRGESLTISATNGISTSEATFTNSTDTVTALNFSVDDGNVFTNATLNFIGNLKLVKKGAGAFVAVKYPQEYAGVTEIAEGLVRCGISDMNQTNQKSLFGSARTIDLLSGGVLDPAGSCNWSSHTVSMNGGIISNTVAELGRGTSYNSLVKNPFDPALNLRASAVLAATADFNFQGTVVVSGESDTLEVNVAPGKEVFWNPASSTNLHLKLTGGGDFGVWQRNPVTGAKSTNVTLEVTDANLCLYYYEKGTTVYAGGMDVARYISSCANVDNVGEAALTVSDTFTPVSSNFYGCTMLDGSTIDLSEKTNAWSITSLSKNNNTVKFAEDATVKLDLGKRTLTAGEQILAWTAQPKNVTFVFEGDNVDPSVKVVWGDDGLAYGYAKEPEIAWTGAAGDNDLANGANWEGGVVPTTIKATLTGDVSGLHVSEGGTFNPDKIWFKEATLSKDAEFPWLDINKASDESVLDLCGNNLKLWVTDGVCTNAGTITDTTEGTGGTVRFSVAENCIYTNSNFNFSGSLSFVKEGAGLLIAEKYPQDFTGTNVVAAGGIRCGEKVNMNAQAEQSPFGSACTITLNEGTYLDPAGSYAWGYHTIVLNGGMISNTVVQTGMNNDNFNAASTTFIYPFNPRLVLEKDATLATAGAFNFKGAIVANGHTLTIEMPSDFRFFPTEAENAIVETKGAGALRLLKNFALSAPTMTLIMNGPKFDMGGFMAVSNYVAKSESIFADVRSSWTKPVVYGTFTPATNNFLGCVLQEGATLDLSEKEGAWNILRRDDLKSTNTYDYVSFADNATVTIDIGTRDVTSRHPVVSWTEATKPANLDTLTFVLNAEAAKARYRLFVADDGIYAKRNGFAVMIR